MSAYQAFTEYTGLLPSDAYQRDVDEGHINDDPQQRRVLPHLDRIQQALIAVAKHHQEAWWRRTLMSSPALPKGLYMVGSVGIGKTYLMDVLYDSVPIVAKKRIHFHHFMQRVHHALTERQGESNPLKGIARDMACLLYTSPSPRDS